jgi:uncharacterized repeat protein (TIGR01451 family)
MKFVRLMIVASLVLFSFLIVFQEETRAQDRQDTLLFYNGQALLEKGKHEEAILKFQELLDHFPQSNLRDLARYWIAHAYWELGQKREAQVNLDQLQDEFPGSPLIQKLKTVLASTPPRPVHKSSGSMAQVKPDRPKIEKRTPPSQAIKKVGPSTKAESPKNLSARLERPPAGTKGRLSAPKAEEFSLMITQVAGIKIELEKNGISVYPGEMGVIPFRVVNTGNAQDGFRFSVNLPKEYQPEFYFDENGNGRPDTSDKTIQEVSSLGINQSIPLLLQFRMPRSVPDGVKREVELLASSMYDPNISQRATATLIAEGPQLKAEFAAREERVRPGETLTYVMTVSNVGVGEARNVKLQQNYHPNLSFVSARPSPRTVEQATRALIWDVGNLPSQGKYQIEITFRVGDETLGGIQLINRGTIEASVSSEPINYLTPQVTVQQVAIARIETSAEDLFITPGDILYLPIMIHNLGNGNDSFAIKVSGADMLDSAVFADLDGDGAHQDSEPQIAKTSLLRTRESFPAVIRMKVPVKSVDQEKVTVGISVTSNLDGKTTFDVSRTLHFMIPMVKISTQSLIRESVPGGVISYQLMAINSGSGVAKNVMIRELLPKELKFVSSDPQSFQNQGETPVWKLDSLAPNQKKVLVINVMTQPGVKAGTVVHKETQISYTDLNGNSYE